MTISALVLLTFSGLLILGMKVCGWPRSMPFNDSPFWQGKVALALAIVGVLTPPFVVIATAVANASTNVGEIESIGFKHDRTKDFCAWWIESRMYRFVKLHTGKRGEYEFWWIVRPADYRRWEAQGYSNPPAKLMKHEFLRVLILASGAYGAVYFTWRFWPPKYRRVKDSGDIAPEEEAVRWSCPGCGAGNSPEFDACWSCQGPRPEAVNGDSTMREEVVPQGEDAEPVMWECSKCGEENPPGFDVCWNCKTAKGPKTDASDVESE